MTSRDAKDYFVEPKDIQDLETAHFQWTIAEVAAWCENYRTAKQEKQAWCEQFIKDYKALLKKDKKMPVTLDGMEILVTPSEITAFEKLSPENGLSSRVSSVISPVHNADRNNIRLLNGKDNICVSDIPSA